VTCDERLFHRRAAATGNALSSTVERRTSRYVDEAEERSRRLAPVSAGRRSSSHRLRGHVTLHHGGKSADENVGFTARN